MKTIPSVSSTVNYPTCRYKVPMPAEDDVVTYESDHVKGLVEMTDTAEQQRIIRNVYGTGARLEYRPKAKEWRIHVSL